MASTFSVAAFRRCESHDAACRRQPAVGAITHGHGKHSAGRRGVVFLVALTWKAPMQTRSDD
eukprot:6961758-Prymnesium_polylepis.1